MFGSLLERANMKPENRPPTPQMPSISFPTEDKKIVRALPLSHSGKP